MELRTFETLEELKTTHQKDINDFPITYMFGKLSDDEIKTQLAKIGATSLAECCSVFGCGDVLRKEDVPKLRELLALQEKERKYFTKTEKNLVNMILDEMNNHEYGYTRDPYDTLMALGKTSKAFEDERFAKAWKKAEKKCFCAFDTEE